MLEHEGRLLLERQAPPGRGPALGPLAAPLLLPPGPAPPAHRRPQPPHRVEDQLVDLLEDVEDAQLMVGLGPQLGQHGRVEVRAVGDDGLGSSPQFLRLLEEPPHVIVIVGTDQGEGHRQVADRVGGQQAG